MLVIRQEQMEVLGRYMLRQFEARMVLHLRATFPEPLRGMSESDLRDMIRDGIDKAAQYDVTTEGDVQRYLECMVLLGPNYDRDGELPWAGEILRRKDMDGQAKMDAIDEYSVFSTPEGS
jgi:hypothetical protein